jgi:hypothetical protein
LPELARKRIFHFGLIGLDWVDYWLHAFDLPGLISMESGYEEKLKFILV